MTIEEIKEYYYDNEFVSVNGFDDAVIGVERYNELGLFKRPND